MASSPCIVLELFLDSGCDSSAAMREAVEALAGLLPVHIRIYHRGPDAAEFRGRGVVTIPMYLSHQEIAMVTGTARQTVTTILNQLRSEGLIDFSRAGLTIHDMDALRS